jgi:hypothetical protein
MNTMVGCIPTTSKRKRARQAIKTVDVPGLIHVSCTTC